MKVRTLRQHQNTFGKKFVKKKGDVYDHSDPHQLIEDGLVEEVKDDGRSDNESGGSGGPGSGAGGAA